jgi:hypothetical protein
VVRRTRWFRSEYVLEREGGVVARAERPRFFNETRIIKEGTRQYVVALQWDRRGWKDFQVRDGERVMGSVSCRSQWLRRASADLSTEMSIESRMFVLWLALDNWRTSLNA